MDAELKAKWVAALRSGQYTQGKDVLHSPLDGSYCCLGVLHHIATGDVPGRYWSDDCERPKQMEFLDVRAGTKELSSVLTSMNDEGQPFPEIADWIEAHL